MTGSPAAAQDAARLRVPVAPSGQLLLDMADADAEESGDGPTPAARARVTAAFGRGVGARLDESPEPFFSLRQVHQTELLSSPASGAISRACPGASKRIAPEKLADVFGIEVEAEPPDPTQAGKPTRAHATPSGQPGGAQPKPRETRRSRSPARSRRPTTLRGRT